MITPSSAFGRRLAAALAAATFLGSCTNLAAVSGAAVQLNTAAKTWDEVADLPGTTCRTFQPFGSVTDCREEGELTTGLHATNKILASYFNALAHASQTGVFTVDKSIETLGASVGKLPGMPTGQAAAVSGLAAKLVSLWESHEQTRLLDKLITLGGDDAVSTLDTLRTSVVPVMKGISGSQEVNLGAAYSSYVKGLGMPFDPARIDCSIGPSAAEYSPNGGVYEGTAFLLVTDYCRRSNSIAANVAAIDAYQVSLSDAANVLRRLQADKGALGRKVTAKELLETASQLASSVDAVRKAF